MQTVINTQRENIRSIPKSVQEPIKITWILFLLFLSTTSIYYFLAQPELPIFYSLASKQDQLAPKMFLFVFPLISFFMNVFHLFIVRVLKKYSVILIKLFVGTTLGLQVLLGFALFRIILITI